MTFSAPAKIHLLGEHSVVYGKPAILSAINLRIRVTLDKDYSKPEDQIVRTVKSVIEKIIKKHFKVKIPAYSLKVESQAPLGYGLGSSAAVSAASIACLLDFLKIKWDLNLINELTFEAEKVFHGNPSGGDNTTVVFGGLIWYRKELEFLKTFTPLPIKVHKNFQNFYLVDSGKPAETTKEMVEKVSLKFKVQSSKLQKLFDDQERLVKELAIVLKEGNGAKLIQTIRQGERNLQAMGVVGKKAKAIIRKVERQGGAAKVLGGAGVKQGSGMLLGYFKNPSQAKQFAKDNNLEIKSVKLAEEGLRHEAN